MASPKSTAKRIARPLTPEALGQHGALDEVSAHEGGFDPKGAWTQTWRVWAVGTDNYRGIVEFRRRLSDDGAIDLKVDRLLLQVSHLGQNEVRAELRCRNDALASPRSWRLTSRTVDLATGDEYEMARVEESAEVRNGAIELRAGGRTFTREAPEVFTSNWSLFDAVQRMPGEKTVPLEFDLLQGLDQLKRGHRLRFREKTSISHAGKTVAVCCYQQLGRGLLPYHYYVDEDGRLLLVTGGSRAYILDAAGRAFHDRKVKWAAKRRPRGAASQRQEP